MKTSQSFTAVEGKTLTLLAIGYEKGGVTTPLEERPAVRFEQKMTTGVAPGVKPDAAPVNAKGSASFSTGVSVGAGGK